MSLNDPAQTSRVVAAVASRDDRYLVCLRPMHKRHGGLWEFPGGKVEPGEGDADALKRELKEELGVELSSAGPELFARHDKDSPYLIAFIAVDFSGTPQCREHLAITWATLSEIAVLALAPSDAEFVAHMLAAGGPDTS